jgi:isoquinoline 1-oxidoreductase beta subunit
MKISGVRHVVPVTAGILPGVAVVADDTWTALRGRRALTIEWTPGVDFDSDRFLEELPRALDRATFKVRHEGDAMAALDAAPRRHEAMYVFPFQAHAPMETMNCTADVRTDRAEIWAPTQTDVRTIAQVKRVTGLAEEAIRLHPIMMGGGFGRRLFADYAAEAAEISKAIARPVQVMWTREDDMQRGYFQPATANHFVAGLDARGAITALVHHTSASDLTIYDVHEGRDIWRSRKEPKKPDQYEPVGRLRHAVRVPSPARRLCRRDQSGAHRSLARRRISGHRVRA